MAKFFSWQAKSWAFVACAITVAVFIPQEANAQTYKRAAKGDKAATTSSPIQCTNGKSIDGTSGVEKYLKPDMICVFFPIWIWKYPPEVGIDGNRGGVYTTTCNDASQALINDLACTVKGHDLFHPFAERSTDAANIIEIATFFAHVGKETGGLGTIKENAGGGYCDESSWNADKPCQPGKEYTGRGYHQISWNYNYWAYSNFWFNEQDGMTLLRNPELVADDLELAWGSALWFWFTDRDHNDGACTTRTEQVGKTLLEGYGFGNGISIINGGIECTPSGASGGAEVRVYMFLYMLGVMDESLLPSEIGSQETKVPRFLTEGCPAIDSACSLNCRRINDRLVNSYTNTYPTGWNDGWTKERTRFVCKCNRQAGSCSSVTSGGTTSDKSKWPWPLIGSGGGPTPSDPCSPNPCGTGTCSKSGSSYTCSCPSGYTFDGTTCKQAAADPCSPNPCGSGTCSKSGSSYTCTCPSGSSFNGSTCVAAADPCANNPCGNGTCSKSGNSYTCSCQSGYTFNGSTCVQSSGGGGGTCDEMQTCYERCVSNNI